MRDRRMAREDVLLNGTILIHLSTEKHFQQPWTRSSGAGWRGVAALNPVCARDVGDRPRPIKTGQVSIQPDWRPSFVRRDRVFPIGLGRHRSHRNRMTVRGLCLKPQIRMARYVALLRLQASRRIRQVQLSFGCVTHVYLHQCVFSRFCQAVGGLTVETTSYCS